METAMSELPLALFTTLAPMGAGAFVALALAFCTTKFSDEQLKKIDRLTLIPLAVLVAGFVCSFFHLASPLRAMGIFAGVGSSPLSNEILVGCIFVVLAVVYEIVALTGKLSVGARKGFSVVVAVAAIVFACFCGMAYMMETIASWNTMASPLQMIGFGILGGMALGTLVLSFSGAIGNALSGLFKTGAAITVVVGVMLAVAGLGIYFSGASGMENALYSGTEMASSVIVYLAVSIVCLIAAALANIVALVGGRSQTALAVVAVALAFVGIFVGRLVFYALEISVGL